jgi:nicotinamidase/pyrazinamidase
MKKDTLFWDVDTQYDFMRPEGRLYVAGAEGTIDSVSETRRFAMENGYSIVASTDWHREGNEELSNKPDFKTTFPHHCMAGKPGSERVGYLGKLPTGIVPNEKMGDDELQKLIANEQFHIVIRKEELDVFSNPNTTRIMKMLKPKLVVIFGVALDLCVQQTIERLMKMGGIKLYLLKDAVKGLGIKEDRVMVEELKNQGVEIISVADLKKKF